MENRDSSTILITDEEMIEITGAHYPNMQCQILRDHGIPFVRRRDGRPRTTWYNFNHPISSRHQQPESDDGVQPNFEGL